MKSFPKSVLAAICAAVMTITAVPAFAEVVVVVNPKSSVASMTAEQVANIFLGKSNSFPSGGTAVPVDGPEAPWRDEFYTKVTGKTAAQVKAIWARLVFTGKGQPPRELPSAAEVKKFVAGTPDAIAYLDKSAVDGSVKVVFTAP